MELIGQFDVHVICIVTFNSGGDNCYSFQRQFVNITKYMDIYKTRKVDEYMSYLPYTTDFCGIRKITHDCFNGKTTFTEVAAL